MDELQEQQDKFKEAIEAFEKISEIVAKIVEHVKKALSEFFEFCREWWKSYKLLRMYNGRWAKRQKEFCFLRSQKTLLLVE